MTAHTLLQRQIRRSFGVDSMDALLRAVAHSATDPAALADVTARLQRLGEMVSASYAQFDRDLDLRARSLALSSQELNEANQRLRDEADQRKEALDTLHGTARALLTDLDLPQADDVNSDLLGLSRMLRDLMQQRQQAHRDIERARVQFHSAIEALDVGFIMFDEQDRLVVCNSKYREITPLPCLREHPTYLEFMRDLYRSDLPGVDRSTPEEAFLQQRQALYDSLADGPRTREASGGGLWVRLDESRSPDGLTVTLRTDITASKQAGLELLKAKDAAEAASTAKTRFLANMSHELRTPLNAVIGAAQLLATDSGDTGSRGQLIDSIQRSGLTLLGVIENILDLSRIEAGELNLAREDFHLVDCVEAALATTSVGARAKGLTMACVVDPDLPAWRHGDAMRLRQVLLNLLGNAVKFTAAGEVVLRLRRDSRNGADTNGLVLSVSDTGVGISETALPHIFKAFRQGDDRATRRFGGSGLGLAIVHQLVQAMGGTIQVHSQPGRGACFEVLFSLPPANRMPPTPQPMGVPIAYFEPHEASAQGLAAQLQRLGCPAQRIGSSAALRQWLIDHPEQTTAPWLLVACDGGQAWGLLEEAADDLDPEHVIGMTGAEAADIDLARETMQLPRNIIKPVLRSALVSRLGVIRGARPAEPARLPAALLTPEQAAAAKHILVVEDDALNQSIVCQMLHHAGYRCSAANDGAQALAMLSDQAFDLALMDWQMPDMDGLEVTRRIRQGRAGQAAARMPIVALTANAYAEDRSACLAAGMNDFLTKPVLADRLLSAIERWTGQAGSWRSAPLTIESPNDGTAMLDETEVYDPAVLAALPMVADGSDPGYADELLKMFTQSARTTLDRLDGDLAMRDMAAVQRRAHILKSSAAQVGALALSAEAARIESTLRRGGMVDVGVGAHLRLRLTQFEQALSAAAADRSGAAAARKQGAHHVEDI